MRSQQNVKTDAETPKDLCKHEKHSTVRQLVEVIIGNFKLLSSAQRVWEDLSKEIGVTIE